MAQKSLQSFYRELVDTQTGEVITYENQKVITEKINVENFYMTFVDYIAPVFKLRSEVALKLLIWMCENAQFNTGQVSLTTEDRKNLTKELGISTNQITNNLKRLRELKLITGQNGKFQLNPQIFWKGDAKTRQEILKDKALKISFELVDLPK